MPIAIQIPEGKKLVHRFSYETPTSFDACQQIWLEKKWWQFWLPKRAVAYSILIDK